MIGLAALALPARRRTLLSFRTLSIEASWIGVRLAICAAKRLAISVASRAVRLIPDSIPDEIWRQMRAPLKVEVGWGKNWQEGK